MGAHRNIQQASQRPKAGTRLVEAALATLTELAQRVLKRAEHDRVRRDSNVSCVYRRRCKSRRPHNPSNASIHCSIAE